MAQIQKGTTYSTGDQVTAANLNALADAAILLPGAITDQTAKTVPLAADTILLHSAADTALRKSTLTQLFSNATGIPISTGISGLGTGIAAALAVNTGSAGAPVLFNGALGTPSSGTVTNLTGTASININGTVGATTANTGQFTTLFANGLIKYNGSSAGELQFNSTSATTQSHTISSYYNTGAAFAPLNISAGTITSFVNGSNVSVLSSTGLAVTGALSATGSITGSLLAVGGTVGTAGSGRFVSSPGSPVSVRTEFGTDGSGWQYRIAKNQAGTITDLVTVVDSGYVGIGTTSPAANLEVSTATTSEIRSTITSSAGNVARLRLKSPVSDYAWYVADNVNALVAYDYNAGAERMRIDSSGNFLVGTTSSNGIITAVGSTQISHKYTGSSSVLFIGQYNSSGDASINNTANGPLVFATNNTERARIDSSGNLLVGKTADVLSNTGCLLDKRGSCTFTRDGAPVGYINRLTSDGDALVFMRSTTQVGAVYVSTTATSYNTSSDYRLKDITGPLTDSGTFIDALKPKVGTWKADGSKFVGFIAHEFAEVSPSSVTGEKDAVDSDGKPIYQAMQASSAEVIANLVAELQSVRQRLAALESK